MQLYSINEENLPFSVAHKIVGDCVKQSTQSDLAISFDMLQQAAMTELGRALEFTQEELQASLSAENFVAVRTVYGGSAPPETRAALTEQSQHAAQDKQWLDNSCARLEDAQSTRTELIAQILAD